MCQRPPGLINSPCRGATHRPLRPYIGDARDAPGTSHATKETVMQAGDVMTRDVVTVRPDAMIREAAQMMDELNVGALPVCDGRRLVGIITDRDIVVRSTADGMRPDATPVHMVMTDEVCWCFEDDSVEKIEDAMARRQIR